MAHITTMFDGQQIVINERSVVWFERQDKETDLHLVGPETKTVGLTFETVLRTVVVTPQYPPPMFPLPGDPGSDPRSFVRGKFIFEPGPAGAKAINFDYVKIFYESNGTTTFVLTTGEPSKTLNVNFENAKNQLGGK